MVSASSCHNDQAMYKLQCPLHCQGSRIRGRGANTVLLTVHYHEKCPHCVCMWVVTGDTRAPSAFWSHEPTAANWLQPSRGEGPTRKWNNTSYGVLLIHWSSTAWGAAGSWWVATVAVRCWRLQLSLGLGGRQTEEFKVQWDVHVMIRLYNSMYRVSCHL